MQINWGYTIFEGQNNYFFSAGWQRLHSFFLIFESTECQIRYKLIYCHFLEQYISVKKRLRVMPWWMNEHSIYRKVFNLSRTKSRNSNVSRLVLQLSLPNLFKLCVKMGMKMSWEQHRQAMLRLYLSDQQLYCLQICDLYQTFDDLYILIPQPMCTTCGVF